MVENDHGHLGQAHAPRREQPGVPGQDSGSGVDQNRVGEAEFANTARDLFDLLVGVGPGVPGVGDQPVNRPTFDCAGKKSIHIVAFAPRHRHL